MWSFKIAYLSGTKRGRHIIHGVYYFRNASPFYDINIKKKKKWCMRFKLILRFIFAIIFLDRLSCVISRFFFASDYFAFDSISTRYYSVPPIYVVQCAQYSRRSLTAFPSMREKQADIGSAFSGRNCDGKCKYVVRAWMCRHKLNLFLMAQMRCHVQSGFFVCLWVWHALNHTHFSTFSLLSLPFPSFLTAIPAFVQHSHR